MPLGQRQVVQVEQCILGGGIARDEGHILDRDGAGGEGGNIRIA